MGGVRLSGPKLEMELFDCFISPGHCRAYLILPLSTRTALPRNSFFLDVESACVVPGRSMEKPNSVDSVAFFGGLSFRAALKGDKPKGTNANLRFSAGSAVSCDNLRFLAKICVSQMLRFLGKGENQQFPDLLGETWEG